MQGVSRTKSIPSVTIDVVGKTLIKTQTNRGISTKFPNNKGLKKERSFSACFNSKNGIWQNIL